MKRERERECRIMKRARGEDDESKMCLKSSSHDDADDEDELIRVALGCDGGKNERNWWKPIVESNNEMFSLPTDEEAAVEMLLRDAWRLPLNCVLGDESCTSTSRCDDLGNKTLKNRNEVMLSDTLLHHKSISLMTQAQLYTVIHDRTDADRAIQQLCRRGSIIRLKLATLADDYAIARARDVVAVIASMVAQIERARDSCIDSMALKIFTIDVLGKANGDVEIHKSKIMDLFRNSNKMGGKQYYNAGKCVSCLITAGFLRRSPSGDSFFLSLPKIGLFVSSLINGRKFINSAINKKHFPEILEKELKKKKCRDCVLSIDYLIRDMKGAELISVMNTTSGALLRLGRIR